LESSIGSSIDCEHYEIEVTNSNLSSTYHCVWTCQTHKNKYINLELRPPQEFSIQVIPVTNKKIKIKRRQHARSLCLPFLSNHTHQAANVGQNQQSRANQSNANRGSASRLRKRRGISLSLSLSLSLCIILRHRRIITFFQVEGRIVSEIGPGLLVLVGLHESDSDSDADYMYSILFLFFLM
jgi:hypothetical protein